jgi:hydroxypyruvate reductase
MADAARLAAADADLELAGGLVVGATDADVPLPLESVVGDHPVPGRRSRRAAERLGALTQAVLPGDHVLLLISGGTSSLLAAPADGVDGAVLDEAFRTLLGAGGGVDITVMNAIRRRFLRWGGGRLAAAVAPAPVHQVILSDVVGDDPAVIASAPATPDPLTAAGLRALLEKHGLTERLPRELIAYLDDVVAGRLAETPKPGDAAFANVDLPVIIGRVRLHDGIAIAAREAGVAFTNHEAPVVGEASVRGREFALWLATEAAPGVHCWSGETTVTLGDSTGRGGRSQEFALSAAVALDALGPGLQNVTLLAAGTDGRDGPTDAAGAVVDGSTAKAIRDAELDPAHLLARHDAYPALDAAGLLLRTGPTGTNVADVVIAVVTAGSMIHTSRRW